MVFALTGALIFAVLFAPVLASWIRREKIRPLAHAAHPRASSLV